MPYNHFHNGAIADRTPWLDTAGHLINAHDGGIIYADGVYHWYGLALRPFPAVDSVSGGQKTTEGVVMYASTDLYNWSYERVILSCSSDPASPLYAPMRFERPKIIYNEHTREYVLWCHYVKYPGDHGGAGEAGLAYCSTVNGTYTWGGASRPIDSAELVRDCTLFKDSDGAGYFIYDRDLGNDNRHLTIIKLTPDYHRFTRESIVLANTRTREAPVMMKRHGMYFLITSGLTGWKFSQSSYYTASQIMGPYTLQGDPCVGEGVETTFDSQGTHAIPVEGKKDALLFISERHMPEGEMTSSSYIFLPVLFPKPDRLELKYLPFWDWRSYWP